jgi:DNA-binding NarL/FixJ family response regulator
LGFLLAAMRGARKFCNSVRMVFGVLIVDDNRLFLEAARALLEREGLRVVGVAATSAEALRRAQELLPEVVLVDITLAGESGFDLARRLAGQFRGGGPTVILISTHVEADFADLIAESPAAGFVPKPELSADAIRRIVDGRAPGGPRGAPAR